MEKEKEITKKITPSKAEIAPKSTAAAAAVAAGPKTSSKKPRQKGVAVPKLNLNPIDEDSPPQPASTPAPLLLPTFQAKSSSKKLKPISIGSSVAAAPATQPEPAAPLQQLGEEQGEEREE